MKGYLLLFLLSSILLGDDNQKDKNWYYECYEIAKMEYSNTGATITGIGSGFLLGLIGTGLGYLIIDNQDVEVPHYHLRDLDSNDRWECQKGYSQYVKKKRKNGFLMGGGIGTLLAVLYVTSTVDYGYDY